MVFLLFFRFSVRGLEDLESLGLGGFSVTGLKGLKVSGLDGLAAESGLSKASPLIKGWDNELFFRSIKGVSMSTPLTNALL